MYLSPRRLNQRQSHLYLCHHLIRHQQVLVWLARKPTPMYVVQSANVMVDRFKMAIPYHTRLRRKYQPLSIEAELDHVVYLTAPVNQLLVLT